MFAVSRMTAKPLPSADTLSVSAEESGLFGHLLTIVPPTVNAVSHYQLLNISNTNNLALVLSNEVLSVFVAMSRRELVPNRAGQNEIFWRSWNFVI